MVIYKNREYSLVGRTDPAAPAPEWTIVDKDGNRELVRIQDVQLTQQEYDNIKKTDGERMLTQATVIKDADLKKLQDDQNPDVVAKRNANRTADPIRVNTVMVDPAEVTPAMTTMTSDQANRANTANAASPRTGNVSPTPARTNTTPGNR